MTYLNPVNNYDHYLFNFCFIVQTILFPFIIVLVKSHSQNIIYYRFYILNNVTWCYILTVFMFIVRPSYLLPTTCIVADGIIKLSNESLKVLLPIQHWILANLEMGVVYSLFYR